MTLSTNDPSLDLNIPVTTVQVIIELARDLQCKVEASLFDTEAADPDDFEIDILEDRGVDPAEIAFKTFIEDLTEDAQIDLVALTWLGRDDGDWFELRRLAAERRETPTSDYLRSLPLLAHYLADGLAAYRAFFDAAIEGYPI